MEKNNNFRNGIIAFAVGAAAGAILALLYSPKTGRETREQLKDLTDETTEDVEEIVRKGKRLFSKSK